MIWINGKQSKTCLKLSLAAEREEGLLSRPLFPIACYRLQLLPEIAAGSRVGIRNLLGILLIDVIELQSP